LEKPRGEKKSPGSLQTGPGHKDGNATIKEKQMNKDTLAHLPERSVHSRQRGCNLKGLLRMLDHLVHFEPEVTSREGFVKLDDASPEDVLSAQVATEQWLAELGVDDDETVANQQQTQAARKAFNTVTTNADTTEQKASLAELKTPAAVRHLTGMLAAYDWQFIEMAQQLRGYTVAKILEETKSPNANLRLKALIALGKVTEVGLFTEQIEVKKVEMTDAEVEQRIKDKLAKFMGVIDVVDIAEKEAPAEEPQEKNTDES
jgi:hypothetical protein